MTAQHTEQLFNDFRWWFETSNHDSEIIAEDSSLNTKRLDPTRFQEYLAEFCRFKDDWLGSRCDGKGPDVCATSLWQLTHVLCSAPNEHHEVRAELCQKLAKVDSAPNNSILRNIKVWIAHVSKIDVAKKQLELLKFQLHTAHAALLLTKENSTDQAVVTQMQIAMQFAAKPEDCIVPSGKSPQDESPLLKYARLGKYARLREELRHQLADADVDRNRLEAELLKLDRGITWLLGGEPSQEVSRRLPVPLVVKSRNPQGEVEVGSLAYLRVRTSSQTVADLPQGESTPHLIADPVYCGLMTFDKKWTDCLGAAMRWAVEGHKGSHILFYDLNFPWAGLAQESHLKKWLERQSKITGGSASLAAGLLAKATIENRDINSTACVTGCVEDHVPGETTMGEISGGVAKLGAFDNLIARQFPNHKFVCGLATEEDRGAIDAINELNGFSKLEKVKKPQDAYRHITGETDLIRRYAAAEMSHVWGKIDQFIPNRLRERLNAGISPSVESTFSFENLSVLEELNMQQTATERKRNVDRDSEDEEDQTVSLDSVVGDYAHNPNSMPCLTLLGAPGIGKTWVGLRWHLKLIQQFWSSFIGQTECENTKFPIWVTVWEIQARWSKLLGEDANPGFEQILVDLVVRDADAFGGQIDSFREFVRHQLASRNVFLIVDSWDERNREHNSEKHNSESFVVSSLRRWIGKKNPLVITSRQVGEFSDPALLLQREAPAWLINPSENRLNSNQFAKRWFGEEYPKYQRLLHQVFSNRNLEDLCRVPQLVAMVCWYIENENRVPEDLVRPSQLILEVIKAVLKKYVEATRNEKIVEYLVDHSRLYELLKLLAFRTFGGGRWQVTLDEIEEEFESNYQKRYQKLTRSLSHDQKEDELYNHLKRCGLFDAQSGDMPLQIVHQTLAEALVAAYMVEDKEFQEDIQNLKSDYESSVNTAARLGLLDIRFRNVWRYFAELSPRSNSLVRVLGTLKREGQVPAFPVDLRSRARAVLHDLTSVAKVGSDDPEVERILRDYFLKLFKEKCENGRNRISMDELKPVINLCRQGYLNSVKPIKTTMENTIQIQINENRRGTSSITLMRGNGPMVPPVELKSMKILSAGWDTICVNCRQTNPADLYREYRKYFDGELECFDSKEWSFGKFDLSDVFTVADLLEIVEQICLAHGECDPQLIRVAAARSESEGIHSKQDLSSLLIQLSNLSYLSDICLAVRLFNKYPESVTSSGKVEQAIQDGAIRNLDFAKDQFVNDVENQHRSLDQLVSMSKYLVNACEEIEKGNIESEELADGLEKFRGYLKAKSFAVREKRQIEERSAQLNEPPVKNTATHAAQIKISMWPTQAKLEFDSNEKFEPLRRAGKKLVKDLPVAKTVCALVVEEYARVLTDVWKDELSSFPVGETGQKEAWKAANFFPRVPKLPEFCESILSEKNFASFRMKSLIYDRNYRDRVGRVGDKNKVLFSMCLQKDDVREVVRALFWLVNKTPLQFLPWPCVSLRIYCEETKRQYPLHFQSLKDLLVLGGIIALPGGSMWIEGDSFRIDQLPAIREPDVADLDEDADLQCMIEALKKEFSIATSTWLDERIYFEESSKPDWQKRCDLSSVSL